MGLTRFERDAEYERLSREMDETADQEVYHADWMKQAELVKEAIQSDKINHRQAQNYMSGMLAKREEGDDIQMYNEAILSLVNDRR